MKANHWTAKLRYFMAREWNKTGSFISVFQVPMSQSCGLIRLTNILRSFWWIAIKKSPAPGIVLHASMTQMWRISLPWNLWSHWWWQEVVLSAKIVSQVSIWISYGMTLHDQIDLDLGNDQSCWHQIRRNMQLSWAGYAPDLHSTQSCIFNRVHLDASPKCKLQFTGILSSAARSAS